MTESFGTRRTSAVARLTALLILIGIGGCDNVEWGGLDFSVVPPPPQATDPGTEATAAAASLPEDPILYYVRRDTTGARLTPVAELTDDGMQPISTGDDPTSYGERFISAFLREGAEFTLYHRGRRSGTLIVDGAEVPETGVCRVLPRATGRMELSGDAGQAVEFLAMARTQAPEGRVMPGDELEPSRRMLVLGPILAERALRARQAQLPSWASARRQTFTFPVSETRDFAFTSTFLVDDELRVGNDDVGYSLFMVYTPQAQSGYDTAYVAFNNYPTDGKAAPRVIDFLDWDRDGSPELLMEVYGTSQSWFEAVGATEGEWDRLFQDRCDPGATVTDTLPVPGEVGAPGDTATAQPPGATPQNQGGGATAPPPTQLGGTDANPVSATPITARTPPTSRTEASALALPEPLIRLSIPGRASSPGRADTSGDRA